MSNSALETAPVNLAPGKTPAVEATALVPPNDPKGSPDWFTEARSAAWTEFLSSPHPLRTQEAWRFSNIGALNLDGFQVADTGVNSAAALISKSERAMPDSARFVFANNQLLLSETANLPEGVIALPLLEAVISHPELVQQYFMSQPVELGSHKFACLHRAMVSSGMVLFVPKNVRVSTPIELFHWVEGDANAVFPHTLIVCAENSSATVIDHFLSADGKRALCCGVNDLHLAEGANLNYFAVQDWSPTTLAFQLNSTVVAANAQATSLALNLGGSFVRGESLSRMTGEGARSIMLSANPMEGSRMVDQRTLQCHDAPGAFSDLLYHNSLDETARSIFAGLIRVAEGAHRTDAYQKVKNLILSDDAEATSMPGLEILADNVRCTHGATSGEISDEEVFYLQARGISKEDGRRMIVMGFFNSLLERVEEEPLRKWLSARVRRHLGLE